jgi:hypothetical protein
METPTNCDELLYDDVIRVETAKRDHFDFMQKMRDRGIEVVEMHNLLTQTVAIPEAKKWILDNQIVPNQVGLGLVDEIRSYLESLPNRQLAETLIGGLSTYDFPETHGGEMLKLVRDAAGITEYLLPPLPNTIFTRDTTCWIYGGVTVNPLYWPARHEETILVSAIYKFHPDFAGKVNVWWGDPTEDHGLATLEGGDVMQICRSAGQRFNRHGRAHLAPGVQPARGERSGIGVLVAIAAFFLATLAVAAIVLLCYRNADRLAQLVGQEGARVVTSLSAFLLLCVGVQIITAGAIDLARLAIAQG